MFASTLNKTNTYSPRTVADWLARTPGGVGGGRDLRYGYFGPGSSMMNKDITGAGDTFIGSDFFVNTFGAKVWDSLNSQTRAFNLFRKVAWGPTTGYRIRTGRNGSTRPVGEVGALPDIDKPDLATNYVQPVFIVTSLGVSALSQFLGTLEGGIGDALAVNQESAMIDHTKKLNQMILASSSQRVVAGGGSPDTVINGGWLNIGDVVVGTTVAGDVTVTAIDPVTNAVTYTGNNLTTDEIIVVKSRAGSWSLDDIVDRTGLTVNGVSLGASLASGYGSLTVANRDQDTWSASHVYGNAGVLRHLGTGMIDQGFDRVRRAGGDPDLILTGIEQITRVGTILQANQHFIGEGVFQVKQGQEGTLVGYPTGFQVATYKGTPMFHDFDIATSYQLAANGDAVRGGHMYILDTRFLELPVLFTTQYMESRDFLQNNMIGIKAIYLTAFNFRAMDFVKQAKIIDLSDGVNVT